ncbi:sulfotransferase domain protein [Leptolyngbya sp. PCC 7375]|nr:sulfotransferase domain protein [Leptolyngbya sp. PCC 7375]
MSKFPINIYHCCVFKTGSQWIRGILQHPLIKAASELDCYRYEDHLPGNTDSRKITERFFDSFLPKQKILSPLFLSFNCFQSIPKPAHYRAFFITRDPRDITVSLYYSILYSHREMGHIAEMRNNLKKKSQSDGLFQVIDWGVELGIFEALLSWASAQDIDPCVKIFRFEDLTCKEKFHHFTQLMNHCQIGISRTELKQILKDLSFENLSGRSKGSEDINSHYRKGISGDWKNHFNGETEAYFFNRTNSLLKDTGYL